MAFTRAEKQKVWLKLAMTGPTGSGKTFSALRLAGGLSSKIALADTENSSASLYADRFQFDTLDITPPFWTDKFIKAIDDAVKGGYDVLIIDSLSHFWAGEGGLLQEKEALDRRPGSNHYANWGPITKKFEALKNKILQSPIHIIACMRSKMDYAQSQGGDGKKSKVEKVGLAPVMRDGIEYEFTIVFDVGMSHEFTAAKDRTGLFMDRVGEVLSETHGTELLKWRDSGTEPEKIAENAARLQSQQPPKVDAATPPPNAPLKPEQHNALRPSDAQLKKLGGYLKASKWSKEQAVEFMRRAFDISSSAELSADQYEQLVFMLGKYSFDEALYMATTAEPDQPQSNESALGFDDDVPGFQ